MLILRRRKNSGIYYFRYFWQNIEITKSLGTNNYKSAREHLKSLKKLVMEQVDKKPLPEWQVREIFDKYIQEAVLPKTEEGFKSRNLRIEHYKQNNKINDTNIGLLTESKLLNDLLDTYYKLSEKEKLKKLKEYRPQIKPIIKNYDELATSNNAYIILCAQKVLAEHDRKNYNIMPNIEYEAITLEQALSNYLTAKKADNLKKTSYDQLQNRTELMLNILSGYNLSCPLNSFGVFDFERIQETIAEYPLKASEKNALKQYICNPTELVEQGKRLGLPTLSRKTANEYLSELNSFLKYCVKKRFIAHNHLDFSARGKKSNKNTRKPYSDDDILKLLESPKFTKDFEKTLHKQPEWHWIVLLAMTTGARLTEICQLRTYDIDLEARTIQFQETDEEENSLKNLHSTRTIPISNFIIQCGFLEYVKYQKRVVGDKTVLWGWTKTNLVEKYGWGRYFGKQFNVYNKAYITPENLKSFHSFRHTVITNLNRYLPELHIVITRLVGHANQSVNLNTYTHTQWEEKMLTVINYDIYPRHFEKLDELRLKLARFWFSLEQEG